jgi:hypothetical protein
MLITEKGREVEISESNWILAKDLFIKWGYNTEDSKMEVKDIDGITSELSAWGIPWKRTTWDY